MSEWTIYHNPRCSKSREALAMLVSKGIDPDVVDYLKAPLDQKGLRDLLAVLGAPAAALLRTKEAKWQELGLNAGDEKAVIKAISEFPILMERPVVRRGNRAVIGRPTENIADLF